MMHKGPGRYPLVANYPPGENSHIQAERKKGKKNGTELEEEH